MTSTSCHCETAFSVRPGIIFTMAEVYPCINQFFTTSFSYPAPSTTLCHKGQRLRHLHEGTSCRVTLFHKSFWGDFSSIAHQLSLPAKKDSLQNMYEQNCTRMYALQKSSKSIRETLLSPTQVVRLNAGKCGTSGPLLNQKQ